MNMITELSETDFDEILSAAHTAVVDFYAPWCGPCKLMVRAAAFVPAEIGWKHL